MRVLVTGAAGMLGHDVLEAAGEGGEGLGHDELDITDLAALRAALAAAQPDVVVNCAAWTDVDGAESREAEAERVNVAGAGNVARAAAELGAPVVHVSSDYVFDGRKRSPYLEDDATGPLGAYGRTKLAGERAVAAANPRHHIVRSSWLFGVHGANFVRTMLQLAAERDSVRVVDDQVGCPTYTAHLAAALLQIAGSERFGVWHAAGTGSASWFELASEIFARTGASCTAQRASTAQMGRPAPRPAHSVLASARDDAVLLPDWRDGLDAYLSTTTAAAP